MSDTPPTVPSNQAQPADDLPEGYQPPLVAGGLFVDPNWSPRLADRFGSVRTDQGGVSEHWHRDIAPVFFPDIPNSFWIEVIVEPLSLTSITPNTGPPSGGTPLTLTGTGFVDIVAINWEIASYGPDQFVIVDSEHITCLSPPGPGPGEIDVEVVNANDDVGRSDSGFTYVAQPPAITGNCSPATGPGDGGTAVTIPGTGFTGSTGVLIGGNTATSFQVVSDTQISVTTPVATGSSFPGAVPVVVQNPNGDATRSSGFIYTTAPAPEPTITSINPISGPVGTVMTATGTNLVGNIGAFFGGFGETMTWANVSGSTATTLTVTVPQMDPGTYHFSVQSNDGGPASTLNDAYTVPALPPAATISSINPATGDVAGGDAVDISGGNFASGMTAAIGGAAVTGGNGYVNPMRFEGTSPPGTAGPADVTVTNAGGTGTLTGGFTYTGSGSDVVTPMSSDPETDQNTAQVAQSIAQSAQTIGDAAQDIGDAAQTLTEPSGTTDAPSTTSEASNGSTGTTEASQTPPAGMSEYEMDQMWGISPAEPATTSGS